MNRADSLRVGRIGGIGIDIHFSFIFVVLWGAWQGWVHSRTAAGVGAGVLSVGLLFSAVLVHEVGHGLQASELGLVVRRITLLPIGGVAELETAPRSAWQELLIAMAGPAANLAAMIVLGLAALVIRPFGAATWAEVLLLDAPITLGALIAYLLVMNATLFFFNMLPAFPMDGGRIIRAGLALFVPYSTATQIATWMGRILAISLVLAAAIGWPITAISIRILLILLALMVYFGARHEGHAIQRRRVLLDVEVGTVCHPPRLQLLPSDRIDSAALGPVRQDGILPVISGQRVVGVLTVEDVRQAISTRSPLTAAHLMRTELPSVGPGETLWVALREMIDSDLPAIPITTPEGHLCGLITLRDVDRAWRLSRRSGSH